MKLIGNILGCIIGLISLVALSCCLLLLAVIARDGFKWAKQRLKEENEKLRLRWCVVKKRYVEICHVVSTGFSKLTDALFISSEKIAKHSVKFILMWSLPAIFVLTLVAIVIVGKEENLREQLNDIEFQQRELDLLKREHYIEQAIDSLNHLKAVVHPDTVAEK